jgi:hypothetical protein
MPTGNPDLHLEGPLAAAIPIPPLLPKMAPHHIPAPALSTSMYRPFVQISTTWGRCYDFENIFAENFSEKFGVLTQNKL